jgi:hypothetical protein
MNFFTLNDVFLQNLDFFIDSMIFSLARPNSIQDLNHGLA